MDNIKKLGQESVVKLLIKYSVPAVIAMLVNAIYNVVDRIFIGQFAGEEALAALTVAFPLMMIIFAFASLIGTGGSALLSISLGQNNLKKSNHVFANTISFGLIVTGITLIGVFLNLDGLLSLFGASAETLGYAKSYMSIIIGGFIFQMLSFILNSSVRTEGKPVLSMFAMMASAVTNIILDYIFIGIFDMGVSGAALATIIGQFSGLSILLSFYLRGKSQLRLNIKDLIPDVKLILEIVSIGFASFVSTMGTSIAMAFMNVSLSSYGGLGAVTAMGAINSLYTFFIMPIMGITQGMQPIIGYNHGAGLKTRVNQTLKYGIGVGMSFSILVFVLLQAFPTTFIGMFLDPSSETIDIAVNGLRIYIAMLPLLSINIMGVSYFQSTAKGKTSMVLGMLRQFVILVPMLLVLPSILGLSGVWLAVPLSDGLAILATLVLLVSDTRGRQGINLLDAA
ncbi:MATE family efflux transporter [Acidaminobacter sp. JC074]|uniref:MATE family efflux transporter n=1 Tax=Acidaminobacter sp. JC074 TaxID=2530199 RepID=UPI001F0E0A42|nr:MATE family efflux transporter [Acidaminobacter sp. JC074]MCH4886528.1 MATE family efflux transporter [Acidaminobacter sp. JC074]